MTLQLELSPKYYCHEHHHYFAESMVAKNPTTRNCSVGAAADVVVAENVTSQGRNTFPVEQKGVHLSPGVSDPNPRFLVAYSALLYGTTAMNLMDV